MKKWFRVFREVFSGARAIDDGKKYMYLGFDAALVHLVFAILFGRYNITVLFWYNLVAVGYYVYLSFVSPKKRKFLMFFISSLIEILMHSSFASVMLGWNWGFMLYTIALVPLAFYLTYTMPKFKKSLVFPVIWSMIVAVFYFGVRLVCDKAEPCYAGSYPDYLPVRFYYFNMFVMFILMLIFSILLAVEIRYMQGRLEEENKNLGQIALLDPLTHLLNRRSMEECMENAFSKAVRDDTVFCLIMSDIDDFKTVNDTYGHDCGDMVLVRVADIMSSCVRKNDYVCRWGGEEMLILLQTDIETAKKAAERICREVESTGIEFNGKKINVTITLGVSEFDKDSTIHTMIREADRKLYEGKKSGKNQVVA